MEVAETKEECVERLKKKFRGIPAYIITRIIIEGGCGIDFAGCNKASIFEDVACNMYGEKPRKTLEKVDAEQIKAEMKQNKSLRATEKEAVENARKERQKRERIERKLKKLAFSRLSEDELNEEEWSVLKDMKRAL